MAPVILPRKQSQLCEIHRNLLAMILRDHICTTVYVTVKQPKTVIWGKGCVNSPPRLKEARRRENATFPPILCDLLYRDEIYSLYVVW